ncbi:MAG: hypothetical protein JSW17_05925 [Candidatus Omnitrophota bacterium]|nr:MAG: hypothetical protein JSW17_05925 [Candidatus Omnitrophota bacterium]
MRDNPLSVSLLLGIIAVLVIVGGSSLIKMKLIDDEYRVELTQKSSIRMTMEEAIEANSTLQAENETLKKNVDALTLQVEFLSEDLEKLKEINQKLENSLKEALIKQKLKGR